MPSGCSLPVALQLLCFSYKGRDPAEQLSDSPPLDDPNVEWFHITGYPRVLMTPVPPAQWPKVVAVCDSPRGQGMLRCDTPA